MSEAILLKARYQAPHVVSHAAIQWTGNVSATRCISSCHARPLALARKMNFCESTVVVKCWIAFVAGPVVPCPVQAAICDVVHVERSFNARKDEASEQNGSERHGYVDAEQNSVPECLRQNLYKQLRTTIKMLKNDKKNPSSY